MVVGVSWSTATNLAETNCLVISCSYRTPAFSSHGGRVLLRKPFGLLPRKFIDYHALIAPCRKAESENMNYETTSKQSVVELTLKNGQRIVCPRTLCNKVLRFFRWNKLDSDEEMKLKYLGQGFEPHYFVWSRRSKDARGGKDQEGPLVI